MAKDLLKSGSTQEPLELLYRNGQPAVSGQVSIPRFKDICLTKTSQANCEDALELAADHDHPIHNDQECRDYMAAHRIIEEVLKKIRDLKQRDREPFKHILQQILIAIEPMENKLVVAAGDLNRRITEWRAMVLEGQRREQQRLIAEAEEKHNEAKYSDNPEKRRQAKVQAKALEKAARVAAPQPQKGLDTEEYWEGEIYDRGLAAKQGEDIVDVDCNQVGLNRRIKILQREGVKITPNLFPGIKLTRKFKVRYH